MIKIVEATATAFKAMSEISALIHRHEPIKDDYPTLRALIKKILKIIRVAEATVKSDLIDIIIHENYGDLCVESYSNGDSNSDLDITIRHISETQDQQDQQLTSIQNDFVDEGLNNDVILQTIFGNLCNNDLKNCRLVNRKWEDHSTSVLLTKKRCKLSLDSQLPSRYRPPQSTLVHFNQCAISARERGSKIPISCLEIRVRKWDFDKPKFERFFTIMGSQIRHLILKWGCKVCPRKFGDLISEHLPNLENLDITNICMEIPSSNGVNAVLSIPLPCLKSIRFHSTKHQWFLLDLLRCATNLKIIDDFRIDSVNAVVDAKKIDAVQNLYFYMTPLPHTRDVLGRVDDVELYVKLAEAKPSLKTLNILVRGIYCSQDFPQDRVGALNEILISSRNSLIHLSTPTLIIIRDNLAFANVTHLHLFPMTPMIPLTHRGLKLSKMFPNLRSITFEDRLKIINQYFFNVYFPGEDFNEDQGQGQSQSRDDDHVPVDVVPSVKFLEIKSSLDSFGVEALAVKFPNATHYKFSMSNACFDREFKEAIWKLPSTVEVIQINGLLLHSNFCGRLDSFFTGIPEAVCKSLLDLQAQHQRGEDDADILQGMNLDVDRMGQGIEKLQHLKQLKLFFDHGQNALWRIHSLDKDELDDNSKENNNEDKVLPVISNLSGLFGFSKVPNLRVTVGFDYHQRNCADMTAALESVGPYVQFVHHPLGDYFF